MSYAHDIEVKSEIKLGEMLKKMEKNKGTRGIIENITGGTTGVPPEDTSPTLSDLSITKKLSAEAQALAELPKEKQEAVATGKKSKRAVIAAQLKATPELSDRTIARELGVSNRTVSTVSGNLEDDGQVCKLHTSTGLGGKSYPRERQEPELFPVQALTKLRIFGTRPRPFLSTPSKQRNLSRFRTTWLKSRCGLSGR